MMRSARFRAWQVWPKPNRAEIRLHPLGEVGSREQHGSCMAVGWWVPCVGDCVSEAIAHALLPEMDAGVVHRLFKLPHRGRDPSLRSLGGCLLWRDSRGRFLSRGSCAVTVELPGGHPRNRLRSSRFSTRADGGLQASSLPESPPKGEEGMRVWRLRCETVWIPEQSTQLA